MGAITTSFIYDNANGSFTLEASTIEVHTVGDLVFKIGISYFEMATVFK